MRRFAFAAVALMILTTVSLSQPPAPPKGSPPTFNLAKATKKGKSVIVQVSMLAPQTMVKEVNGQTVQYSVLAWQPSRSFVLGKGVQAYRTDGEPATPAQVVKALAAPTATACFVHYGKEPGAPDPFYLNALRSGAVVLVLDPANLYPTPAPKGNGPQPVPPAVD